MTRRGEGFGDVYGGAAPGNGEKYMLDGSAWSLGRCDEVKLRAAAVRDLSTDQNVPLAGIEITDFWFSEIVTENDISDTGRAESVHPFSPHAGPDPFRPCDVQDSGDI